MEAIATQQARETIFTTVSYEKRYRFFMKQTQLGTSGTTSPWGRLNQTV